MTIFTILICAALVIHGLAHLSGVLAAWDSRGVGFNENPWIISPNVNLHDPAGRLFGFAWLFATLTLVASGFDPLYKLGLWPWLPVAGAGFSLVAIVPWWKTVPLGAKAGAVFDLLILVLLLPPWRERVIAMLFG